MDYGIHNGIQFKEKDTERFWSKVIILNEGDCWYWDENNNSVCWNRYGRMNVGGKIFISSRLALIFSGVDLKDREPVLHSKKCVLFAENNGDVLKGRLCCNPKHLRIGTIAENVQDTKELGRMKNVFEIGHIMKRGENSTSSKLSNQDVINIRADNRKHKEISFQYGVKISTITAIKNFRKRKYG